MPWGPSQSVTAGSIATNIDRLFVFGATDAYKDLVSGNVFAGGLVGGAAFGSDAIGTYLECFSGGDRLTTASLNQNITDSDYSVFITFSRRSTPAAFAALFDQVESSGGHAPGIQDNGALTTSRIWTLGANAAVAFSLSSPVIDQEFSIVITKAGTSGKMFYKSGAAPLAFTHGTFIGSKNLISLCIGGWLSGESYPGRFRAYGRWTRALSDAEAQSMADNPQQIIASPITPTDYSSPMSRGIFRGVARGTA